MSHDDEVNVIEVTIVVSIGPVAARITNFTTDQSALLALKSHITNDPHNILTTKWSTTTSICNWVGVTCGVRHLRVTALNLSYMDLTGTIPPHLGNLSFLVKLHFRNNSFHGTLPQELARLLGLQSINFGFNNFTGTIPVWFGSLSKLQAFNIFGNQFSGSMPAAIFNLSALQARTNNHLRATNRFHESNLLGTGGFGSVYKGTISDGIDVAVKVFNLQIEGAFKSFDSECDVLSNIRHRNLIKIISCCSQPDFRALVLQYMSNGSLENQNSPLNILQRLNIMTDVASALEYLHHDHGPNHVVHCDVKPGNILLDDDMVAHVADLGIARLLGEGDSMTQTIVEVSI
ncbi:Leucine-rich repeat protein kinase family protein [Prunus dulcis]|uniref:Leucine-rich repeat protein kinase family protein n=1 Tax=Prunus dulcis TaxID=3755 RepID=A0A4Y1RAB8_PRUDU|nr:Leucine-rich repeat protein kinase family protein [Prunus dulcis]